ncbi:hypothetical protein KA005_25615, partial [bacterium]|nr:hypothetical protein [bacterium]
DGPDYRIHDYVTNLLNTVLDFQSHPDTISAAIEHYEDQHGYRTHKKLQEIIDRFPNTKRGNLQLAHSLWGNNHWSRAKFLRKILYEFEQRGIKGQQSLKSWISKADFETDIKGQFKTKEHSIGIALFHWLCLKLGIDTVKPDVHIVKFVSDSIGRNVSQKEALDLLIIVAEQTNRKAALVDAAIWHYQRDKS